MKLKSSKKSASRTAPKRGAAKAPAATPVTVVAEGGNSENQVEIVNATAVPATPPSAKKARLAAKPTFEDAMLKTAMATVLSQGQLANHVKPIDHPFLAYIGKADEASYWVKYAILLVLKCEEPEDLQEFLSSACPMSKKATPDSWRQHILTAAAGNQAKVSRLVMVIFQQLTFRAEDEKHVLQMSDKQDNAQWNNWIEQLYSFDSAMSTNLYYDEHSKLRSHEDAKKIFEDAYHERKKTDTMKMVLCGDHPTSNLITLMDTDEEGVLSVFSTFLVCCIYKNDISHFLALFADGQKDFRKLQPTCLFSFTQIFSCVPGDFCTLQSIAFVRLCMSHWMMNNVVTHRWWQSPDMKAQHKKAYDATKIEFHADNQTKIDELQTALRLRFHNMIELEGLTATTATPAAATAADDASTSDDEPPG
jgi:hypothetical protein